MDLIAKIQNHLQMVVSINIDSYFSKDFIDNILNGNFASDINGFTVTVSYIYPEVMHCHLQYNIIVQMELVFLLKFMKMLSYLSIYTTIYI